MTAAKKPAAKKTAPKKAVEAKKVEAVEPANEAAALTFEHRGIVFEVPHPLDLPLDVFETDDEFEVARLIVGAEQWTAYKATGATLRDFAEFAEKMSDAAGLGGSSGN